MNKGKLIGGSYLRKQMLPGSGERGSRESFSGKEWELSHCKFSAFVSYTIDSCNVNLVCVLVPVRVFRGVKEPKILLCPRRKSNLILHSLVCT